MNATKILWGQALLVSAFVLAFIWAATEWTAWELCFQSHLGHPRFELFGWPVYQPPAFFWWWFAYDAYAGPRRCGTPILGAVWPESTFIVAPGTRFVP